MDKNLRKRAYDYVISDLRNTLLGMKSVADERCDKGHSVGAINRLTAIDDILKFLGALSESSEPWSYFDCDKTYNTRRITRKTVALLKKHNIIEGTETAKDIHVLNAFSKAWGLVDLIVEQMRNRLTRQKCTQLLQSHATCRWERASETFLSNQTSKGKIRRCLIYLYINKLLPNHHRRDVQSFIRLLERYDNIDWSKAPDTVQQTKHRLEQLNATIRQRRKKEREKTKSHEE